jgi:hypothetical protein
MDWKPKLQIFADSTESEPTKPSQPGIEGFEGARCGESPKIYAEPEASGIAAALAIVNRAGVRLMRIDGAPSVGVWSDQDGPEIRAALRVLASDGLPVRYLDGAGIPMRYKLWRGDGEPVPMHVLNEMEQQPEEPWKVRDRMVMSSYISWAAWKAAALHRLFQELGVKGQPGRNTAATAVRP